MLSIAVCALAIALSQPVAAHISSNVLQLRNSTNATLPRFAQTIPPSSFAVLDVVNPGNVQNGSTLFIPPGSTEESLKDRPFIVYDEDFYNIIGSDPTLTLIAKSNDSTAIFHEAPIWFPETDEFFFVQSSSPSTADLLLTRKVSVSAAAALANGSREGFIDVQTLNISPLTVNPNGGTNFNGQLLFVTQGSGSSLPPTLALVNPYPPYNSTVLLNNFFGRQFNSPNDVAVNPRNKQIYFTDPTYGHNQGFRPAPVLPEQAYRFDPQTGLIGVAADGFVHINGITFSPDGRKAYLTDTGAADTTWNYTKPATIYSYNVSEDGTLADRETFAYVGTGIPDGIHCDTNGNVYTGVGDGVMVYSPSGKLLGKIYIGSTSGNFQFAGKGRMIICADTELYFVTLAAEGDPIWLN